MSGSRKIVDACDVYPYEVADGPTNMALDEAILEAVGRGEPRAALRVYGWSVPTLSLGYFQRLAEVRADGRFNDVPIVRRPTGGGAIWHHHEVTYALALPEGHALSRPSVRLYRAVHGAITGGFVRLGIGAVRSGEVFSSGDCGAADRYYALLTAVRKISFAMVPRSWEVRSVGAGGLSSNMDPFYSLDRP